MIAGDLLITVVVMVLLSTIAVLLLLYILVITGVKFYENKKLQISPVNIVIVLISLFILYLGLPFWFLKAAYSAEGENAETLHKVSINTALLPSVRSFMKAELGAYYMRIFEGEKAIKAFEDSMKIQENKHSSVMLCMLYSFKGDRENAVDMCLKTGMHQLAAVNYSLKKDYEKSLNIINREIESDKDTCWNYALRASVNRKLGKKDLFERDYKNAKSLCPGNAALDKLYKAENYYENVYNQKKKEFRF